MKLSANVVLGAAFLFATAAVVWRSRPAANDRLPAFDVVRPDSGRLRSTDYAGRAVVVNLWASWCAPCREEFPALDSLAGLHDTSRAVFLALSEDVDGAAAREFLEMAPPRHLRIGMGLGQLGRSFRYPGLPYTLLAGPDGRVLRIWYGYGGRAQLIAIDSTLRALDGDRPPVTGDR